MIFTFAIDVCIIEVQFNIWSMDFGFLKLGALFVIEGVCIVEVFAWRVSIVFKFSLIKK